MHLEFLQVKHVRNLESVQISPGAGLNLFAGKNASGKTALLEAIYILSRGKSFRTPRLQNVVQNGANQLLVTARLHDEKRGVIHTGIEKSAEETQIRFDGIRVKALSEQTRNVPIALVTQDSHLFITSGPAVRRHWMDWALFHVEPDYLQIWKSYMKFLRHRNMLLKKGINNRDIYRAWEQGMVESGSYLVDKRSRFLDQLAARLNEITEPIFPGQVSLKINSLWPLEGGFDESWHLDIKNGYTRNGAHNVDIKVGLGGKLVVSRFSRGQIKMFICLLAIAQAGLQAEKTGCTPAVLIDDYKAELDENSCEYLLTTLEETKTQVFLTDTEKNNKYKHLMSSFHVEQGSVKQI